MRDRLTLLSFLMFLTWIVSGSPVAAAGAASDVARLVAEGVDARLANDPVTAISRFDAVLELDPANADVHLQLALAWRMRGDLGRSAHYIEQGLAMAPDHGVFLSCSALILEEKELARVPRAKDLAVLALAAVAENFGYRQLNNLWRVAGWWQFLRGRHTWGTQVRTGFRRT